MTSSRWWYLDWCPRCQRDTRHYRGGCIACANPLTVAQRRIAATRQAWRDAKLWEAGQRTVLDAVAPEWVEHTPTSFTFGADGEETYTRTLVVRDWPPQVQAGWLAPLLFDLDGDVSVALHSDRLSASVATRRLRGQRTVQTSVAQARLERGAISDPAEQLDLASAEEIAKAVAAGEEALFSVGLSLTLRAPNLAALDALERRVRDRLDAQGVSLSGMRWQHAAGFQTAGMVYGTDRLGPSRRRTLDTTTLAMTCPFLTHQVGTMQGPLLGVALADHAPVRLDLWAEAEGWPAAHLVIPSPTGGGKTVTQGSLIAEHLTLPDPPDVVVIDPAKGDYRRLVTELGGQIVRLSTSPDTVINPFDLPAETVQSGTGEAAHQNPVMEQTRLATGLIALMVAEDGERMKKAERSAVEAAILAAYRDKGIVSDTPETWTREGVPVLPDVLRELQRLAKDEDSAAAASVAERLRPFCTGTLARLFAGPTTLRLDAGLTSFDLEGLDSELRPLAVWVIGDYIWKCAKADRRKRILCLDEVKTLLEHPESARLVAHLYSLGRAYRLSVWSASQSVRDYEASPEGVRALENAHTALLLRQARGAGAAAERYGLSAGDQAYLETCTPGAGILVTPKGTARVRVLPSPLTLEWMGGPMAAAKLAAENEREGKDDGWSGAHSDHAGMARQGEGVGS